MLKVKTGFILREVSETFIVLAVGERVKEFNGMITINETGAYLWKILEKGATAEDLVSALIEEYGIDKELAVKDVDAFVNKMKGAGLLE
ncbi:MAG: PqqD family protein [Clostridia bacterium]|nr:PqqD family protein [Clostridia bacterium]